jgi:hypothetical protein
MRIPPIPANRSMNERLPMMGFGNGTSYDADSKGLHKVVVAASEGMV